MVTCHGRATTPLAILFDNPFHSLVMTVQNILVASLSALLTTRLKNISAVANDFSGTTLVKIKMYNSSKPSVLFKSRGTFKYTNFMANQFCESPLSGGNVMKEKLARTCSPDGTTQCLAACCKYFYTDRTPGLFFALPKPPKLCKGCDVYFICSTINPL